MDGLSEECWKTLETAQGRTEDFRFEILDELLPGKGTKSCRAWGITGLFVLGSKSALGDSLGHLGSQGWLA